MAGLREEIVQSLEQVLAVLERGEGEQSWKLYCALQHRISIIVSLGPGWTSIIRILLRC